MCVGYGRYYCELWLKPRQDIMFHGFGIYSHYYKRKLNLILRWGIDEDKGEDREVTLEDEEKDEEHNWHVFEIEKAGDKPFKVAAG